MLKKDPKERPESNVVLMEMRQKNCMLQVSRQKRQYEISLAIKSILFETNKEI